MEPVARNNTSKPGDQTFVAPVSTDNNYYYTLNSLTLFWLAESVQWIFKISARDVITANFFAIVMSRTLKVMGYHVMCDRTAWFLRVIMSSSHALCCLPSMKKQKHHFHFFFVNCTCTCIIKQWLDSVFVISRIIKVSDLYWLFWISQKPNLRTVYCSTVIQVLQIGLLHSRQNENWFNLAN